MAIKHQEYQYLDLLKEILKNGERKVDRGTDVVLYSLFGRQTRYDLSKGFPLLTTKRVYWKGVLHELYWFMKGMTNIKYLVDNNVHIWDDYPYKIYKEKNKKTKITKEEFVKKIAESPPSGGFAKKWGELPRIYGEQWRKWPTHSASSGQAKSGRTIDQLKWVMQEVKDDPDAKNLIVNSWNPEYLYTMAKKSEASRFPICHNMFQISRRGDKLSLQLYQRSADIFLGVPFNIASYALLTIILAKIMGLKPGEFIHTFGDVHIYENHIDQVKQQLKRKPKKFPTIEFTKNFKSIDDFRPEFVQLNDYDPHSTLKAKLTVAGGYYEKKKKK